MKGRARQDLNTVEIVQRGADVSPRSCTISNLSTDFAKRNPSQPATVGLEGRSATHEIVEQFGHPGLQRDFMFRIARKIILSIADGTNPPAEDVEALVSAALGTPFAEAARAVIEAKPRYVGARLIELASMLMQSFEAEVADM
jgi:hypothetical protein